MPLKKRSGFKGYKRRRPNSLDGRQSLWLKIKKKWRKWQWKRGNAK